MPLDCEPRERKFRDDRCGDPGPDVCEFEVSLKDARGALRLGTRAARGSIDSWRLRSLDIVMLYYILIVCVGDRRVPVRSGPGSVASIFDRLFLGNPRRGSHTPHIWTATYSKIQCERNNACSVTLLLPLFEEVPLASTLLALRTRF